MPIILVLFQSKGCYTSWGAHAAFILTYLASALRNKTKLFMSSTPLTGSAQRPKGKPDHHQNAPSSGQWQTEEQRLPEGIAVESCYRSPPRSWKNARSARSHVQHSFVTQTMNNDHQDSSGTVEATDSSPTLPVYWSSQPGSSVLALHLDLQVQGLGPLEFCHRCSKRQNAG